MKFIAIFCLIAAASAQNVVPTEFLAQIFRNETTPTPQQNFLALGVMINQRHIITVAHVLHAVPTDQLRVHLQSATFREAVDVRGVDVAIVHSQFLIANPRVNNIAILRIPYSALTSVTTRPRMLGTLTPRACRTFMFPGWFGNVVTTDINVTATDCPPNTPFCTPRFPLGQTISSCTGVTGSPVICEDGNFVDGINIAEMDCGDMAFPLQAQMSFLSINEHVNWIIYHSDANINSKVSVMLVLLGVVFGKILM
ncbi:hypothetical protein ACKWTF_014479 [Chironomus riparius]